MLNVGVVLAGATCPRWLTAAVVAAGEVAQVTLFVPDATTPVNWNAAAQLLRSALALDRRRIGGDLDLMLPIDPVGLAPIHRIEGLLPKPAELQDLGIEILVVACPASAADLLSLSPFIAFGLWTFLAEGENITLHPCPGGRTLASNYPVLVVDLIASAGSCSFRAGRAETRSHGGSLAINAQQILVPTRTLLRDALIKLERNIERGLAVFPSVTLAAEGSAMSLIQCASAISRAAVRTLANQLTSRTVMRWSIGVRQYDTGGGAEQSSSIRWAETRANGFLADPFVIERDGRHYVFVEEFCDKARKGHIAVMIVDDNATLSQPVKVLECDEHLSFPFLLEQHGRLFMIPERCAGGSVELYEATEFPYRWERRRTLIKGFPGVDTVIHQAGDRLWLFTSYGADGSQDNNLHIYSAASLFDDFRPHRMNPVKTDIGSSRMAGQIFVENGTLYRPAQNCSLRYGGSIVVHAIERLDDEAFEERIVRVIRPDQDSPFPLGLHTYNRAGQLAFVDGLCAVPAC